MYKKVLLPVNFFLQPPPKLHQKSELQIRVRSSSFKDHFPIQFFFGLNFPSHEF